MAELTTMTALMITLVVAVSSFFLSVLASKFAVAIGLLDHPVGRKRHDRPIPLVGGIVIFLVTSVPIHLILDLSLLNLTLMGAAGFLVLVGMVDDWRHLSVGVRLCAQCVAVVMFLAWSDIWVQATGIPTLDYLTEGVFGIVFSVIAVVGLINGFNMIDGIDGLAGGYFLSAMFWVLVLHYRQGLLLSGLDPLWIIALGVAVSIFLLFNLGAFMLPKIFLGDAGSLFLGFVLGWILILFSQTNPSSFSPISALWIVNGIVYDSVITVSRRLRDKKSPFRGDRDHLHHLLLDCGFGSQKTLAIMLFANFTLAALGIALSESGWLLISLLSFLGFGIFIWFLSGVVIRRKTD